MTTGDLMRSGAVIDIDTGMTHLGIVGDALVNGGPSIDGKDHVAFFLHVSIVDKDCGIL